MSVAFVALGANLAGGFGSVAAAVEAGIRALDGPGVRVAARSRLYRSIAWPDPDDPEFANAVAAVETALPPTSLLTYLHEIEAEFGRVRREMNAPRPLDLDIIDYGGLVSEPGDTPILPHPRLRERAFVLLPLAEIAPDWRHPGSGEPIAALIGALANPRFGVAAVKRYYRPLGILSGAAARRGVDQGAALPLAGGPLAFALVEIIERDGDAIARWIVSAVSVSGDLAIHTLPRAPIAGRESGVPLVMGIVNVTPDSFSDGGAYLDTGRAIARAQSLIAAGARIIDIGGESTRPGATPADPVEEIGRVAPVIARLRAQARARGVLLSVDSRNAETMRAAFKAGARMVNDVSALTHESDALLVAAHAGALVVLMHMQGEPATMQADPRYDDVALDVYDYLEERIAACVAAGIARDRIIADPGIGFGKTTDHNLALLSQLALFHGLGVKLLVGVSRKGFIGRLSKGERVGERLPGSLAAALGAVGQGVQIVRVHDVAETVQALSVAAALRHA